MRTLSIMQPWASLLAEGVKTVELRSWSTRYRGSILVRASKSIMPWTDDAGKRVKLPTNCLLLVAELEDVRSMQPQDSLPAMSFYSNDQFAWVIKPEYYVYPTPAAGRLKLYQTPDTLIERLPESEIRQHHPELKRRSIHPFRASVVGRGLLVADSRTGEQTYYNTHLSQNPPVAWVLVPLFGLVGGVRGGTSPIKWKEVADVINEGRCFSCVEDLPQRLDKTRK